MGASPAFARDNLAAAAAAVFVQIREAHTRDGWDVGGPLVAERDHCGPAERAAACGRRPAALRWMRGLCDGMDDGFAAAYGAWPTAFLAFRCPGRGGAAADLVYRARPLDAILDPAEALAAVRACLAEPDSDGEPAA